uniref:Uncharacterized protein n=1 Tax=Anguilla anguilla TaxID=7936 RepID=A0A0E9QU36_ANGAN
MASGRISNVFGLKIAAVHNDQPFAAVLLLRLVRKLWTAVRFSSVRLLTFLKTKPVPSVGKWFQSC